jgi:dihydropteroate synthase
MGIVNITPDSFSDGGQFFTCDAALEHCNQLIADGADILDIGGESTRPGATPILPQAELERVLPVIERLVPKCPVPVSIDTRHAEVARACLAAGVAIVNDVSGFRDQTMIAAAVESKAGVVVMHMHRDPTTMQDNPQYIDVVEDTAMYLHQQVQALLAAGLSEAAICIDPGIGFGKTFDHTREQLRWLARYQRFGWPVCLGVSRKGFLGQITGKPRSERLAASVAVACFATAQGSAQVLRVHDVAATRDAMAVWHAIYADDTSVSVPE